MKCDKGLDTEILSENDIHCFRVSFLFGKRKTEKSEDSAFAE